jgi:hypothetical protein
VNAAAVDTNGIVYADNEDGYLYAINQRGALQQKIFLERAISAGYTPTSIGGDGTIYAENAGHLIAIGNLFSSTTAITSSSQNPSTYGNQVTFTAAVSSKGATPTGKLTFKAGKATLGAAALSSGTASFTTQPTQLAAGSDSITAAYSGDSTHAASTSPVFVQTVNKAATSVSLTSSPNPSGVNETVTLTATVAPPTGLPAATGKVQFTNGKTVLGAVALSNGTATLNTTFTQTGSFTLKASYQGSTNYLASSGTVVQVVQ